MKLFLSSVLLLLVTSLKAQETDSAKAMESVNLFALRSHGRDPITKTNITKSELDLTNYGYEPAVIISSTPSMQMYSDGGNFNGYMYYRLRGVDQTRINATLNGVPLNEPEDQGAYFSNYPDFITNVSSIQIQRGIGISSTGTSSFGGSLNFEGPDLKQKTMEVDGVYGSWNSYRVGATYSSGVKNNFATYVRYSTVGSDGYRDHSGTKGNTVFLSAGYFKGVNTLRFTSFFGGSRNEMAYLASDEDVLKTNRRDNPLSPDEKDKFYQNLNSLQYTYKPNKYFTFTSSAFYNRLVGNYDVLVSPDMLNFQLSSNFYGLISSVNIKLFDLDVNLGLNTNFYDRTHSMVIKPDTKTQFYNNTGQKNDYIGWSKISWSLQNLKLYTDLQFRQATFSYNRQLPYDMDVKPASWTFFNYRTGASYQLDNKFSVYGMFGTSHREPTRTDMFAGFDDLDSSNVDVIGDFTKVRPETVHDLELGAAYITPKLVVKLNAFNMAFRNEIAAIGKLSYLGLPLRKNVDKSNRKGLELEFTVKPGHGFEVSGNTTYMVGRIDRYFNDESEKEYINVEPLATPHFYYNLGVSYEYKKLIVGASSDYTSKMYMDNENTEVNTGAVFVNPFLKLGIFRLTVNNVFNVDNYAYGYVQGGKRFSYVLPTRNYQLAVNLKL